MQIYVAYASISGNKNKLKSCVAKRKKIKLKKTPG